MRTVPVAPVVAGGATGAGVGAGVEQHTDRHAGLEPADDLGAVARVLHEPERDVDAGALGANQVEQDFAAVFAGRVAQAFRPSWRGVEQAHDRDNTQEYLPHTHFSAPDVAVVRRREVQS